MQKVGFGECLKELLKIREWSATRLAGELNIDSSYVRMWIRGERTPSLKSDYISHISSVLANGLDGGQKKPILDKYIHYLGSIGIACEGMSLAQSIEGALNAAQIFSLSSARADKINNKTQHNKITGFLGFPANAELPVQKKYTDVFNEISPSLPYLLKDKDSISSAVLSVLEEAVSGKPGDIYISFQSGKLIFNTGDPKYGEWKAHILRALCKHWDIHCLYRINNDIRRSARLIKEIIEWSGYMENLNIMYFPKFGTIESAFDILIADRLGAFILIPDENGDSFNQAVFFRQKSIIDAFIKYAREVCKQTKPMFNFYSDYCELSRYFTLKQEQSNFFYAVAIDLHPCTIPLDLWKKYLSCTINNAEKSRRYFNIISNRIGIMENDAAENAVRHICNIEVLEYMINSCDYLFKYCIDLSTPEDIAVHLENVIRLLKTYKNFEIGLINRNDILLPATVWETRGRNETGIISVSSNDKADYHYFSITDETIASSFTDYFLEIWDHITPIKKDKEYVISWFEDKLSMIKNKLTK